MQKGVTMEEMALALGMTTKTKDGKKKGQQARLSQYENRAEGPPWRIVQQYADYFCLERGERFDFFLEALGSAKEITLNIEQVKSISKKVFLRFIIGVMTFDGPPCRMYSDKVEPTNRVFDLEELITEVFSGVFLK
jgi:transcriptional regulator with XRE-family HTH domain